jgi:hypothetical protein
VCREVAAPISNAHMLLDTSSPSQLHANYPELRA